MNSQPLSSPGTMNQQPLRDTRLQGHWLVLARGAWMTLVIVGVGSFVATLPEHLARLHTLCTGAVCSTASGQLTPEQAELLSRIGWSLEGYAALLIALTLATQGLSWLVSALIIWRRPHDRMALLVGLMLAGSAALTAKNTVTSGNPSPWQLPLQVLTAYGLVLTVLVLSLFPSGQFVPRWTRWTLLVCFAGLVPFIFFRSNLPLFRLGLLVFLGEVIILVAAQVYRYRRVSGPIERQQTKWVVVGFAAPAVLWIGGNLLAVLAPALADPTSPVGAPYQLVANNDIFLVLVSFPLAIGVAILRFHLWEFDTLINKLLVYSLLTGLLAALYGGLVLGLEQLAGLVSGQAGQPVVIVVSTLAIATLFTPLRHRLQTLIDRRFYRRKYDAAKSLAAFSAALRREVDLEQIHARLLAVIQETMQPASLSLWIFPIVPQAAEGPTPTEARSLAGAPSPTARLDAR